MILYWLMDNFIIPFFMICCSDQLLKIVKRSERKEKLFSEIKHMISNDTGGSYDIKNNSKYRDI